MRVKTLNKSSHPSRLWRTLTSTDAPPLQNSLPFFSLRVRVLRSDLLRYMLLEAEGRVYTVALKPINEWIPARLKTTVRAILGMRYDQGKGKAYPGIESPRLQICQWTMAASRGHPLISRAVTDMVQALQALAANAETSTAKLLPTDDEVGQTSGPVIWTRAVLKTLSEATGTEVSWW